MKSKFRALIEGVHQRYQGSQFLTGDVIKFIDNALQDEWCQKQTDSLKERLQGMIDGDENLRVGAVKALRPAVAGSVQQDQQVDQFYVDVVRETAPGLFTDVVTVPAHLIMHVDTGANLASVPDSQKKDDPSHIDPEDASTAKDRVDDNNPGSGSDISLPKNHTPGKGKKWDDKKPGGGNMVKSVYLEGLKKY